MHTLIKLLSTLSLITFLFTGCDYTDTSGEQNLSALPAVFDEEFTTDNETIINNINDSFKITTLVIGSTPYNGDNFTLIGTEKDGHIQVVFNNDLDQATVHQSSVFLYTRDKGSINDISLPLNISTQGNTIDIQTLSSLDNLTIYRPFGL